MSKAAEGALKLHFDMQQSARKATQTHTVDLSDMRVVVLPDALNEVLLWFWPFLDDALGALGAYQRFSLALSRNMQTLPVSVGPPLVTLDATVKMRGARFALLENPAEEDTYGFVGAFVLDVKYSDKQQRDDKANRVKRSQSADVTLTADLQKALVRDYNDTALPIIPSFTVQVSIFSFFFFSFQPIFFAVMQ